MRLSRKLMLIPVSGLLAFIIIWGTVEHFENLSAANQATINNTLFPTYTNTDEFKQDVAKIFKVVKDPVALAMDDTNSYEDSKEMFNEAITHLDEIGAKNPDRAPEIESIRLQVEKWFTAACNLVDSPGDDLIIDDQMEKNNKLYDEVLMNLESFQTENMSNIRTALKQSENISADARSVTNVVLFICIAVLFVLSYFVFSSVMITVNSASAIADRISAGDLSEEATAHHGLEEDQEIGKIVFALDQMRKGFASIAQGIAQQSNELSSATNFLNDGATSIGTSATNLKDYAQLVAGASAEQSASISAISMRSENIAHLIAELAEGASNISIQIQGMAVSAEQASVSISKVATANEEMSATITSSNTTLANVSESLLSISSSVEELTATLAEVARSCNQARDASSVCTEQANAGGAAMKKLNDSSIKIGKVVDVIHDIADQTNMLALNATIEAARAGEAGKGFAVVAKEIKDLARQTAEATGQIAQQINTMQEDCAQAVQNIDAVIVSVKDNETIIETIADSANQHQSVAQQISESMSEAAAGAEEVAAGSSDMRVVAFEISQNSSDAASGGEEIAQRCAELAETSNSFATKVSNVEEGISDIVQSTNEIHTGIDHVAGAAAELNKSSSNFSSIAETVLEATGTIGGISGKMREAVSRFNLSSEDDE